MSKHDLALLCYLAAAVVFAVASYLAGPRSVERITAAGLVLLALGLFLASWL